MQDQPTSSDLEVFVQAFEAALQRMNEARDDFRRYRAKLETIEKTVRATHATAEVADARWRELLRANEGTISSEIQRLRKEAQSLRELRDEYESIREEMLRGVEAKNIALIEAAGTCVSQRRGVIGMALNVALSKVIAAAKPAMEEAYILFREDLIHDMQSPIWTNDPQEIENRFVQTLVQRMRPFKSMAAGSVAAPLDLSDVDLKMLSSPAKRRLLRARVDQQQSAV